MTRTGGPARTTRNADFGNPETIVVAHVPANLIEVRGLFDVLQQCLPGQRDLCSLLLQFPGTNLRFPLCGN
jgi:hypothetical protein